MKDLKNELCDQELDQVVGGQAVCQWAFLDKEHTSVQVRIVYDVKEANGAMKKGSVTYPLFMSEAAKEWEDIQKTYPGITLQEVPLQDILKHS